VPAQGQWFRARPGVASSGGKTMIISLVTSFRAVAQIHGI